MEIYNFREKFLKGEAYLNKLFIVVTRSAEVMEVTSSVPQQSMADKRSVTGSD